MTVTERARGCLVGALVGDAMGSQVEFKGPAAIALLYPDGLRTIGPSPVWGTSAGQPTDDGELMLALCSALGRMGADYAPEVARDAYLAWYDSGPFDCGVTTRRAMLGNRDFTSEANGALMRQAPLPVWAALRGMRPRDLQEAVWEDTLLTHPNPVPAVASIGHAAGLGRLLEGAEPKAAWREAEQVIDLAVRAGGSGREAKPVRKAIRHARAGRPNYLAHSGHVVVALQNAWYQVLHARSFAEGLIDTVNRGGDTDTNGCIAGALLGALFGLAGIPRDWRQTVLACRPGPGSPKPRPALYWPGMARSFINRFGSCRSARGAE